MIRQDQEIVRWAFRHCEEWHRDRPFCPTKRQAVIPKRGSRAALGGGVDKTSEFVDELSNGHCVSGAWVLETA